RVEERRHRELARQALLVVGHEVADHLDPADAVLAEPVQMTAQDVEMADPAVAGRQVHPRLEAGPALAVLLDSLLDRVDDLGPGQPERVDLRTGQEAQPDAV